MGLAELLEMAGEVVARVMRHPQPSAFGFEARQGRLLGEATRHRFRGRSQDRC